MRYWSGKTSDDGSIHCLGNGQLCVYEQGPDIIQVFGPPYSSPPLLSLEITGDKTAVMSEREQGTAIWTHYLGMPGGFDQPYGTMLDFVSSETVSFVRSIQTQEHIELQLNIDKNAIVVDNTDCFDNLDITFGLLVIAEADSRIYNDYPMPRRLYYQIIFQGQVELETCFEIGQGKIKLNQGTSTIIIIGGASHPECILTTGKILSKGLDKNLSDTRAWWTHYTSRRYRFEDLIGSGMPNREKLIKTIDDVAVLIKVQQSEDGGVLAGHNYHLAYIRDQYGVFRCMLKMGYIMEAKSILEFYLQIWRKYGKLHNAQAMGVEGIFHVHENDEVEITGYLIIQAFDFYEKTNDNQFLQTLFPMLEWAFEAQKKHLVKNMLPFNGDETYIAGGVLPRNTLNDGSSEATLLLYQVL